MKIYEEFEICRTGKLKQFYTLYIYRVITSPGFYNEVYRFEQNLAHEEEDAIKKAEELAEINRSKGWKVLVNVREEPRREYCDLKAFGLEWKKTEKGFTSSLSEYGEDVQNFWKLWRTDKSLLKEVGFAVFKSEYDGKFYAFFRNMSNEDMVKAFDTLHELQNSKVVTGEYVGEIGERLKGIEVEVVKVFKKQGGIYSYYQNEQIDKLYTFKDENGVTYFTKYTGNKYDVNEGDKVIIDGTITN